MPIIEDQVVVAPAFEPQTIEVAGNFMAEDIFVPGIDALNYFRPDEAYCINQTFTMAATGAGTPVIRSAKLEVDNWHDHYTLNVYKVEVTVIDNGNTYTLNGNVVTDWDNPNAALSTLKTVIGDITIEVVLSLEADTNAHTFTCTYTNATGIPNGSINMKVTELFRARQFGDDHDTADPPILLDGPSFNTLLKTLSDGTKGFSVTQIPPTDINSAMLVSTENSLSEAYLYKSNNILYLYADSDIVIAPTNASGMFKDITIKGNVDVSKIDFSSCTDMSSMFENSDPDSITFADSTNTANVTTFASMFANCRVNSYQNQKINGSLIVSSKCKSLASMFYNADYFLISNGLLGMDLWDTSGVTDFSSFAESCGINAYYGNDMTCISNFDMSSAVNISKMFKSAKVYNLNVSSWDLNNVTNMDEFAYEASFPFNTSVLNFANTRIPK